MSAYLIVRVKVTDPEQYDKYKLLTPDAVAAFDGRFVVRGGEAEALEGPGEDRRIVLLEFPTMAAARGFYDSPAYAEARRVRGGAAEMQIIAVEGVS